MLTVGITLCRQTDLCALCRPSGVIQPPTRHRDRDAMTSPAYIMLLDETSFAYYGANGGPALDNDLDSIEELLDNTSLAPPILKREYSTDKDALFVDDVDATTHES